MSAVLRYKSLRTIVCGHYLDKFKVLFDDEVRVTPEICAAVADHFSWNGAASRLLSEKLCARWERKHNGFWETHYAWRRLTPHNEQQTSAQALMVKQQDARLFGELFNDKGNAQKRAALRRLARKK